MICGYSQSSMHSQRWSRQASSDSGMCWRMEMMVLTMVAFSVSEHSYA